jgi:predicted O-methyltransferase YrrM
MEALARERNFPIVGPLVGRLLENLARTSGARRVLELGSGYGYSAYWFSRGLTAAGKIVLTDGSGENLAKARAFLARGGFPHDFEFHEGEALDRLRREGEVWDVIFCDIDKHAYPEVIEPSVARLRHGGLLIFDNLLWSGRVLPEAGPGDAATEGVRRANQMLASHPELSSIILPLRDGVGVATRI